MCDWPFGALAAGTHENKEQGSSPSGNAFAVSLRCLEGIVITLPVIHLPDSLHDACRQPSRSARGGEGGGSVFSCLVSHVAVHANIEAAPHRRRLGEG